MEEKSQQDYITCFEQHAAYNRSMGKPRSSRLRRVLFFLTFVLPIFVLIALVAPGFSKRIRNVEQSSIQTTSPSHSFSASFEPNHTLVPLEVHIMSKCPDARDCLRDLVVPAMETVVNKVDFKLSFIGSVDKNDTIRCMHGPTECLGDIISLCAVDLYPDDPIIHLGFTTCLIMSYSKIPRRDLVESCALEHGIKFEDLNRCVSEEGKGLDLLRASVERSDAAGVKKSCTVRVAGRVWCVRDGGEWKDCKAGNDPSDLVESVESLYKT